jgi:hypothetical protein
MLEIACLIHAHKAYFPEKIWTFKDNVMAPNVTLLALPSLSFQISQAYSQHVKVDVCCLDTLVFATTSCRMRNKHFIGHAYIKGTRPWLLNDHGTLLFGQEHREVHRLVSKVFWRAQALDVNPNSLRPTFKCRFEKIPTISANINVYLSWIQILDSKKFTLMFESEVWKKWSDASLVPHSKQILVVLTQENTLPNWRNQTSSWVKSKIHERVFWTPWVA